MPALGLDFERTLPAPPSDVRRAIADALRAQGFKLTAEQLTRLEATRGSRFMSGMLMPARAQPVAATFDLAPVGDGCAMTGHLVDAQWTPGGKAWGRNETYRSVFGEIQDAVDRALETLAPGAAASFAPPRFWSKGGQVPILDHAGALGTHAGTALIDKVDDVLAGGRRDPGPTAWKAIDSVAFEASHGPATLPIGRVEALLGVAMMIATKPGALPANLARDVEGFASRVEQALTGSSGPSVTVALPPTEEPVLQFLDQQVRIRDGLPIRTLHICRTCHFEKLTNEDYARIQTRNQRLRTLVGGVGATITSGGLQPFIVLGQLFRLKQLDPDYVCPRCQGLDADERVVTFCPRCGEMRPEAVLRLCGKCRFDFRSRLPREEPPAVGPPGQPERAASPGAAHSSAEAGGAMTCPTCGTRAAPEFAFCPGCGTRLPPPR